MITLTAKNPQAPHGIVRFDYTNGEFVPVRRIETMIDHLEIESTCLHKDSHEAQEQLQTDGGVKEGDDWIFSHFLVKSIHCALRETQ